AKLGESKWLGFTINAINALRDLEGTRLETQADQSVDSILSAARARLARDDYLALHEAAHGPTDLLLSPNADHQPGRVHQVQVDGYAVEIACFGQHLKEADRDRWYAAVFKLLRSPRTDSGIKKMLAKELGQEAISDEKARKELERLLRSDQGPEVRASAALALSRAATDHCSTVEVLMKGLQEDDSDTVRQACALGLRRVAAHRNDVRDKLVEVLDSSLGEDIRGGAAFSLSEVT